MQLVFTDAILLAHGTHPRQLSSHRLPLAVCETEQMVATAHEIDEWPVEERLVIIVGGATTPLVIPDELAIITGKVLEKWMDGRIEDVEQSALPEGPIRRRGGHWYIGDNPFHQRNQS